LKLTSSKETLFYGRGQTPKQVQKMDFQENQKDIEKKNYWIVA
jgi:hypothetical protein